MALNNIFNCLPSNKLKKKRIYGPAKTISRTPGALRTNVIVNHCSKGFTERHTYLLVNCVVYVVILFLDSVHEISISQSH